MSNRQDKSVAAFTIVELLVALAITGILLVAVAVAFNASITNYRENEHIFKTINSARQALFRITTQIRTGLVDPNDIASTDRCTVFCADGSKVTYRYDGADNTLYLHDDDAGTDYVLCKDVTAMTFGKDNDTPTGDVKSVQISMTVEAGNMQRTVSAAAVVRKILK
ncbi:MAG: prepilin-type N-terminal cleavage/methylation domain-containing protein [Planctomycetota bacterium]|jgi:type II secretory pathway pseudopilin PulG